MRYRQIALQYFWKIQSFFTNRQRYLANTFVEQISLSKSHAPTLYYTAKLSFAKENLSKYQMMLIPDETTHAIKAKLLLGLYFFKVGGSFVFHNFVANCRKARAQTDNYSPHNKPHVPLHNSGIHNKKQSEHNAQHHCAS